MDSNCDSDPFFRQTYVGRGTSTLPAVPVNIAPWGKPLGTPFGGFWDSDQDSAPNGIDGCPSVKAAATGISNRWGEDMNVPPDPVNNNELGFFQRADACDPYPVAESRWLVGGGKSKACQGPGPIAAGANSVGISTSAFRGISANDSYWSAPYNQTPGSLIGQTYRCACRRVSDGTPLNGKDCVSNPDSDCWRGAIRPAAENPQILTGRGWRPVDRPGCSRDSASFCSETSLDVTRLKKTAQTPTTWDWLNELTSYGPSSATPHFAAGDSVDVQAIPGVHGAHTRLAHAYAIWTLPFIDAPPQQPQALGSLFPDPENDPLKRAGDPALGTGLWNVQSTESRRLRSNLAEKPILPASAHTAYHPGLYCQLGLEYSMSKVKLWFGPDPVLPLGKDPTDPATARVLVSDDTVVTNVVIMRPSLGNYAHVALTPAAQQTWLSTSDVTTVPVNQAAVGLPSALGEPDLFVVDRRSSPARFARLRPVAATDTEVTVDVVEHGALRADVSPSSDVVADAAGGTVAVVDFENGVVEAYSHWSGLWARLELPAALHRRTGAAAALLGTSLLVAGGRDAAGVRTDLWRIDLRGRSSLQLSTALPGRELAALAVTHTGGRILYVGGIDAAGAYHDDVWTIAEHGAAPGEDRPVLSFADTRNPSWLDTDRTAIFPDDFDGSLRALKLDMTRDSKLQIRRRTEFGWETVRDDGSGWGFMSAAFGSSEPKSASSSQPGSGGACSPGEVCGLTTWWSSAGRESCGTTDAICEGSSGALLAATAIGGSSAVVSADLDRDSAWVARSHALERWAVLTEISAQGGHMLSAKLTHSVPLSAKVRHTRARLGHALVATDAGVIRGRATPDGIAMEAVIVLCGIPVRLEPLADDTWAVATTNGLAILGGKPQEPLSLLAMLAFAPGQGQSVLKQISAPSTASCPSMVASKIDGFAAQTALAYAGPARLLASFGKNLFDVRLSQPDAPEWSHVVLAGSLAALRSDPAGGRAYGVGTNSLLRPVFALEPTLAPSESHSVPGWVTRREGRDLMLRLGQQHVELAHVAR